MFFSGKNDGSVNIVRKKNFDIALIDKNLKSVKDIMKKKLYLNVLIIFTVLILFVGCSTKTSVEVVNKTSKDLQNILITVKSEEDPGLGKVELNKEVLKIDEKTSMIEFDGDADHMIIDYEFTSSEGSVIQISDACGLNKGKENQVQIKDNRILDVYSKESILSVSP